MKCYGASDIGKIREQNEDGIFISKEAVGLLPNLFVVADGMGGHKAGEYASKYAIEEIITSVSDTKLLNPEKILREAVKNANTRIHKLSQSNEQFKGMGTTIVAATLIGSVLYITNAGDSRLYLLKDKAIQITHDHSWVEEMISAGKLERGSEKYYENKSAITRAIGAEADINPEFYKLDLNVGDLILLCSDGLTNMLSDEKISEIAKKYKDPDDIVRTLIGSANKNGGHDNISVIVIDPELNEVDIWC